MTNLKSDRGAAWPKGPEYQGKKPAGAPDIYAMVTTQKWPNPMKAAIAPASGATLICLLRKRRKTLDRRFGIPCRRC